MKSVESGPGWIKLRGTSLAIPEPTVTDKQRIAERMRELAIPECTHPVLAINAIADKLLPGVLAASLELAIAKASGGGIEPSPDAVMRQYGSLAGVRFQVWYLARRDPAQKDLTPSRIEELVTEEDRYDVGDALLVATRLVPKEKDDPKALPAGASSPPASTGT